MAANRTMFNDYWLTVAVESSGPWPLEDTRITFRGRELLLIAETQDLAERVAIRCKDSKESLDALRVVRQFMSMFAWVEQCAIHEHFTVGSSRPSNLGKGPRPPLKPWPPTKRFSNIFYYDYLPEPADPRAWLALALFREAQNVDSLHYRFLSYYKIINILHKRGRPHPKKGGPAQVTWINQTLPHLQDHDAQKRLQEIQSQVADVGNYLYESGRCAIAHAFGNPVADPDDPHDTMRLSKDLPLVAALADYAIESEFGVKSAATIRKEHLYELVGFHGIFGPDVSAKLKDKKKIDLTAIPKLPRLTIRATRDHQAAELASLDAQPYAVESGRVGLRLDSSDGLVAARLVLAFPEERIGFAPYEDVACFDDGTAHAVQNALADLDLKQILLCNGRLEIWNAENGKCLGKTDACVPMNVDTRGTLQDQRRIRERLETLFWVRTSPFVDACDI